MQEELDETPVDEELGKLYEIAKYVREEAVGLLGSCFMLQRQLAPDAHASGVDRFFQGWAASCRRL